MFHNMMPAIIEGSNNSRATLSTNWQNLWLQESQLYNKSDISYQPGLRSSDLLLVAILCWLVTVDCRHHE